MSVDWTCFDAVLFDLDGAITPTAEIHQRAWAELFAGWDFTPTDHLTYVDGKARDDGVRSFLSSRGVELPRGEPGDPPGDDTVCVLDNRKNDTFNTILERDGVAPHPGTLAVLDLLDVHAAAQAIVSSSKNARPVLTAAGMGDRFPVVVDDLTAAAEQLPGKPDPAMFLRAAELLDVDRGDNARALAAAGAHQVVNDLAETLRATS